PQTGLTIAAVKLRCRASATTILPLSLRGQAVFFALLLAEPFAECHRVLPAHIGHRMLVRGPGPDLLPTHGAPERVELTLRHLILAHVEGPGDLHLMLVRA